MQVGFTVVVREGEAEFHFFGRRPDDPRSLVAHARAGDLHAVLMGRLTYRSELLDRLAREAAAPGPGGDAALALAAYRCWGPAGLARLEGSFSLVIWDAANKLLLGSRDPLGGYPLFWTNHEDTLALGTSLRPLLGLLPRRALDLDYLAEFLMLPGASFQEVATEHCAYEGVHRVRPGHLVQAHVPGGPVRQQPYWDWLERAVDPGTDRLEELGDRVADGLRRAVGERLRGRVACHVSGGMDSTAVALLARDGLRAAPGQPPLHAISLVFERLGGLDRETPYLECALRQPGLVPHVVPGDDLLHYNSFADPPVHDEPYGALRGLGLDARLAEAAAEAGAETLLTGHGADGLIDQYPYHLNDLLRRGRLWSAWSDARARGRAASRSAWHFLWNFGLVHFLPVAWRAGLGPLLRGGRAGWERQGPGTIAPWIRPDFARSHALRERGLNRIRAMYAPARSLNQAMALALLPAVSGDCCSWYAAAPHGLAIVHPFLDPRFVGLCLGIQGRFRQEPGRQKPLLADAMRDVLPESIRNRRRKSHYNALVHGGLARNLPALEALVCQAPADGPDLFDRDVLLACLRQAALGSAPADALAKLDLTLAWLRWSSLQGEWQRPEAPVAVLRAPAIERSPATRIPVRCPLSVAAGLSPNP